jgi:hypothetical protein
MAISPSFLIKKVFMKIKNFIQQGFLLPRLKEAGVLVVYDPDRRYYELCLELGSEKLRVIDASQSSITSRTAGLAALREFGRPNPEIEGILVYVPAKAPVTDDEKQRDPFAIYSACGAVFPEGDGDEYQSLCLKARADYATEIRRIFNVDPNPSFAVIDAVGGGAGWPNLQARLGVESARDLLFALLTPSTAQLAALRDGTASLDAWAAEVRLLCQSTLGLKFLTRSNSWEALADELWRYLLFSEFVFDLPEELPAALTNVPCAQVEARLLVEDLCAWLRRDTLAQAPYIERAIGIEKELNLPTICQKIEDFGERDTFPFEERACFNQAVEALKRDNVDKLRQLLKRHEQSVWVRRGENQAQWSLLQAAADLIQACEDADRQLPDHSRSLEAVVDYYISNLREVDRLQREFEQAVGDSLDSEGNTERVIHQARQTYRKLVDKVQSGFIRQIEKSSWPITGRLANVDVFDKHVAPKLMESGRRVALFLIDAMRYELGVELAKQLDGEGQVDVQAACAQLPTVTAIGMASLLPGAGQGLKLIQKDTKLVAALDEQLLNSVTQRMETLRKRYGQRFSELDLAKFVKENVKLDSTVELLVLRSNEMDNDFENNPEAAPGLISRTFQRIRSAIHKLAGLGFQDALIVTDHGFFLNTAMEAGDVCSKPVGIWMNLHERMLLGDGGSATTDPANLVLPTETLGIRGEFNQAAMPRALVAYRAGLTYFHGGLSLQEALVPVISVRIRAPEKKVETQFSVALNYKHGAKKITTRLPVIEVSVTGQSSLFGGEESLDILFEAQDTKGKVVGEAKPGGPVNPATRLITMKPGETIQVTLKMELEFEGKFSVKALAPNTLAALGKALELETDYTV